MQFMHAPFTFIKTHEKNVENSKAKIYPKLVFLLETFKAVLVKIKCNFYLHISLVYCSIPPLITHRLHMTNLLIRPSNRLLTPSFTNTDSEIHFFIPRYINPGYPLQTLSKLYFYNNEVLLMLLPRFICVCSISDP